MTFTSAAKSFGIAGLRCAVGHFGSSELHQRFLGLPWHMQSGAGLLGINATIAAWSRCQPWLGELRLELARNRDLLAEHLTEVPQVRWVKPAATYFGWLDVRDSIAGEEPRDYFLRTARVALQPGSAFGSAFSGHVRLNFGTSAARLTTILNRLTAVLRR